MLIDRICARVVIIISTMFCVAGHIVFGFGGIENTFGLMLLGRVIFGIGGEVLHASQSTLISTWFKASELSVLPPDPDGARHMPQLPQDGQLPQQLRLADLYFEDKDKHLNVAVPIFVGSILMSASLGLAVGTPCPT